MKKLFFSHINEELQERRLEMGRDDSKSKGTNKNSLPQTPHKIAPNKVKEEIAQELDELHQLVEKAKSNMNKIKDDSN